MNQQNDPQNVSNNALPTSTLAIVSLVAAILGFTMLPIIGSIVAIVTGYSARKETRAVPALVGGTVLPRQGSSWVGYRSGWWL